MHSRHVFRCGEWGAGAVAGVRTQDNVQTFQASGYAYSNRVFLPYTHDGTDSGTEASGLHPILDLVARGEPSAKFARIHIHGRYGSPCKFWGMVIPSD